VPEQCFVRGDARSAVIASASIVAKEHRDRLMAALAARYPGWGLEVHKGYLTAAHREAIGRLGLSPVHRRSFRVDR
jgi:ribonuclease HII